MTPLCFLVDIKQHLAVFDVSAPSEYTRAFLHLDLVSNGFLAVTLAFCCLRFIDLSFVFIFGNVFCFLNEIESDRSSGLPCIFELEARTSLP